MAVLGAPVRARQAEKFFGYFGTYCRYITNDLVHPNDEYIQSPDASGWRDWYREDGYNSRIYSTPQH